MANTFAAFASQYITRQQQPAASSLPDSQIFFSYTTDNGSRAGFNDTDLDDFDDPHFRESTHASKRYPSALEHEDDDPYLRLDEDEHTTRLGFDSKKSTQQSAPLIAPDDGNYSDISDSHTGGWLAHQASPIMPLSRSPSPSSSESEAPPDLLVPGVSRTVAPPPPPPTTNREPQSLSLTESLLPRDGHTRPLDVFSLPDPRHVPRRRRKYNDYVWIAVWCAGVSFCVLFSIILLFTTSKPTKYPKLALPYTTLLRTVPLLTILTFISALAAYIHIFLLRIFVRPVMVFTSVFIPATLFISALWAFIGSFMWEADQEPTWGETVGLRLFSLIPLALSLWTARRLVHLPQNIHTTSSVLTLTTHLLLNNPYLLALSPAILLLMLLASIPFLTLIFRLLLIGYATHPFAGSTAWEWHIRPWAHWAIFGAVTMWLWTWGVARGLMRTTCAGVIGAWYFADPDAPPHNPTSTHTIHAALTRATGPSFGSVALSALILTAIRLLVLTTMFLQRLPPYIPARGFFIVSGIRFAVGFLENVTAALSEYALVYTGLTGDPFMPSAKRSRDLTSKVESKLGRILRRKRGDPGSPLTLLTVAPLTLTFPFAVMTYLFVAHTLNAPDQALGASVLAGGVTALVGLFCVGLVQDTADTLYLCYCIDKDAGVRRREEVFITFEYGSQPTVHPRRQLNQRNDFLPPDSPLETIQPLPPQQRQLGRSTQASKQPVTPGSGSRRPLSPSQAPAPQVGPSMPSLRTPLPSGQREVYEEDLDPFEHQSYMEGGSALQHAGILPPPPPPDLMMMSTGNAAKLPSPSSVAPGQGQGQHSRHNSDHAGSSTFRQTSVSPSAQRRPSQPVEAHMMTSREMNMKSHMLSSGKRTQKDSVLDSDSESESLSLDVGDEVGRGGIEMVGSVGASRTAASAGAGGSDSDLLPGSGLFMSR